MPTAPRFVWLMAGLAVALAVEACAQERRPRFDPASFLQRLDRNGNALLEPEEMVGRARGFIENLGIDVSGPVAIANIMDVINRQRSDAERERAERESAAAGSDWGSPRLVPGFGTEQEQVTLPGFGTSSDSGAAGTDASGSTSEPSESVMAQVERVLGQFDRNNDQVLDAGEIAEAPWGTPSPQESDTNGDGRLTRDELIERYRRREADSERFNRGGPSDSNSRSSERSSRSRASAPSEPDGSSSPQPSSGGSGSAGRSESVDKRIADYVENLLRQYDSDRDGAISASEMEKMRSSPKKADTDSNGSLSRDELIAYYGGGYRSGGPTNESSGSESGGSARESTRRTSRRESGESTGSAPLDGRRPVPMHEFTDVWTEEKLREFREMDKNGDGVISVEEFRQR